MRYGQEQDADAAIAQMNNIESVNLDPGSIMEHILTISTDLMVEPFVSIKPLSVVEEVVEVAALVEVVAEGTLVVEVTLVAVEDTPVAVGIMGEEEATVSSPSLLGSYRIKTDVLAGGGSYGGRDQGGYGGGRGGQ